ncbi:hypothetical protein GNI_176830 [Gregarina niphandrodes]|uniref:Uncharacterized protein n=1 Tax=Gregarina niphandrodes TaxID=110365 RepID=A0A023AX66_GRENI|nr:hypothetical protein GNI_176830 [Gregarina niphandrodes]EZG43326.1 hypothetical protein GNI_176830 [Gregarina niphandrodes]|eukprot:XP_011133424.1 hypothetical protein GNI_176830 [Gregarina niphandrodes]
MQEAFRVVSAKNDPGYDHVHETHSNLSILSHDRQRIKSVLSQFIERACRTGITCKLVASSQESPEPATIYLNTRLTALLINDIQEIPIITIQKIITDDALTDLVRATRTRYCR